MQPLEKVFYDTKQLFITDKRISHICVALGLTMPAPAPALCIYLGINLTRMDRAWPFTAEYEDYYKQWRPCSTIFPGSYMQAPLLQLRIPHTETAIAFLEYSFKERLYYALGALR